MHLWVAGMPRHILSLLLSEVLNQDFPKLAPCPAVHDCVSAGKECGRGIRHICQWDVYIRVPGTTLTQLCIVWQKDRILVIALSMLTMLLYIF